MRQNKVSLVGFCSSVLFSQGICRISIDGGPLNNRFGHEHEREEKRKQKETVDFALGGVGGKTFDIPLCVARGGSAVSLA